MNQNDSRTFDRRFKAARQKLGITQEVAGIIIGKTPTTISLWENGHVSPHRLVQKAVLQMLTPSDTKKRSESWRLN